MHVYRSWGPEQGDEARRAGPAGEGLDVCRRQQTAEAEGTARCPRCGGELVARMGRGVPGLFCRCPVRRVRAA